MTRPRISPAVVAALTQQVPARLVKKLDAAPRAADAWRWVEAAGDWTVVTDTGETVSLTPAQGVVTDATAVTCTCLLAPRCFHLLAVTSILDLAGDADATSDPAPARDEPADAPAPSSVQLEPEQRRAASEAWRTAAELLEAGALGAGQTLQAELLRSVHSCRATGLVRLANAGIRVVLDVRDLRADRPEFSLPVLTRDLADLLETAWSLGGAGTVDPSAVPATRLGVARRRYSPVGSLRLHGLLTEPVIAGSGYAGVVTYLVDASGRVWTVSAVEPGDPSRVVASYDASAAIGGATLSHRLLGREGLFVQDGTGSADGRLGSGKGVRAVRAEGSRWGDEPIAGLWRPSLDEQWTRARAALDLPLTDRPAGSDLLFFHARVLGRAGHALLVAARNGATERPVRCVGAYELLGVHDDLAVLACAPGLGLQCVARPHEDSADTVTLLAVAPTETPKLRLPTEWAGRANLGLDRLARSFVEGGGGAPVELTAPPAPPDPLDAFRRRVQRMVLGGRSAAAPEALTQVEQEARLLERRLMPTAATLHRALGVAAVEAARTFAGTRARGDAGVLARTWVACAAYERRARRT